MASSDPEKEYKEALKLKEMGNEAFKKGQYEVALKHYSRICMWIGMNPCMNMSAMMGAPQTSASKDPVQEKTDKLRITAFLNIAQANVKLQRWEQVKEFCSRVLKHDEKNEKALYRRGMAYRKEGLYELARKDYTLLKEILAENGKSDVGVDKEFKLLEKNEKQSDKEFMKQMAKSMRKAQQKQNKKNKKLKEKQKESETNNNSNNIETDGKNDLYIGDTAEKNTENSNNNNEEPQTTETNNSNNNNNSNDKSEETVN